jgi:hypothetical protein
MLLKLEHYNCTHCQSGEPTLIGCWRERQSSPHVNTLVAADAMMHRILAINNTVTEAACRKPEYSRKMTDQGADPSRRLLLT